MSAQFRIKLAGQVIGVTSVFEATRIFCKDYLTDADVDFRIETTMDDIAFERSRAAREAIVEGRDVYPYSDEYLETLAVYRKAAVGLLRFHVLLFHGSLIAVDGVGYLFTARSGTGKSTHTRLWRKLFGARAVMVNDDKPLLRITANGVTAYGTPWDGKHHLSSNIAVPLKAICILTRSETNHIHRITMQEALPMLCQQSYRPSDRESLITTLGLIEHLGHTVELYQLGCNMEPDAARVAYEGMNN